MLVLREKAAPVAIPPLLKCLCSLQRCKTPSGGKDLQERQEEQRFSPNAQTN